MNIINFNIFLILFLHFSCVECDGEIKYIPEMDEDMGMNARKLLSFQVVECPGDLIYADDVANFYIYLCDEACVYRNFKYYCVTIDHIEEFTEKSCCTSYAHYGQSHDFNSVSLDCK